MTRRRAVAALAAGACSAQPPVTFVCPMDPEVRAPGPSKCPKCGMKLVAGIPEPREYVVRLDLSPRVLRAGHPFDMRFRVADPDTGKPVTRFDTIHERLFHLFLVGADLEFFAHEHPEPQADGSFLYRATLPSAGEYRVLCDFYPAGGTPQMIAKSIMATGAAGRVAALPNDAGNLRVSLATEPAQPLAGNRTLLFFTLEPADGLEPYLGAWGHLLAASADLVDVIHSHPAWEEGGRTIQFNLILPRPGRHRVWVQFQRLGVVNTAAFTLEAGSL